MIANGWKLIVRGLVATTYWVRDCSALAVEQEGATSTLVHGLFIGDHSVVPC